ncbi:sugar transferase [Rhodobacterales bacterium HKCCE3408]|nr:sugar transferase [Rhodobacterales bacterium HKCCE3408]
MTVVARELAKSPHISAAVEADAAPRRIRRPALYRNGLKRALDIFLVLAAAPVWLPVILIGALLAASDGRTPFYTQTRVGRNGRTFRLWKLRTMVPDADTRLEAHLAANPKARAEWDARQKLKHDPRITRFGRILRKTSLDELPQLLNVLKGDMSLVGPRPMMVCQQMLYPSRRYYEMRPGLTGLWQVSARNDCTFAERARYDNRYAASMSLGLDMRVLAQTVGVVLRGTGY